MGGERLGGGRREVPQETGKLIFSVGKTSQPEDIRLEQAKSGMMERLGKMEDIVKRWGNSPNNSEHTAQIFQRKTGDNIAQLPKPEGNEQTSGLTEIPVYRNRKLDGNPLDFIQAHYGKWLSAFGAEQDMIFQDQIRKHDPKLLQGITTKLRYEGQGRKLRQFVKPRSSRTDREFASIDPDARKHVERLSAAMKMRQVYNARKSPKPPSA
jgi:hypothetical protein